MKWSFVEKLLCLSAIVHVEARVGGGSLQSTGINNEDGSNAVSTKEDAVFWDRILQESHGSMIQSPTDAPVPAPTANAATPAPVPSPTTSPVSAPVTSPTNVPTPGPTSEPVTPAPTPTPATPAPVPNPTASPVSLPVPSPTNVPTPLTSEPATSAPTPSPTEAVVETGSPTVSPTASVIDATSAPTSAPVAVPTATATTGAPTFFMPGTDPPKPGLCPMRVFTSCATLEGNIPCLQYPIPDDPTSEDCIARVEYTYNMTNFGNDTRRVYSLSVLRNNELTIVLSRPPEVPIILVEPGESFIAKSPSVVVLDVCTEKGIDIFDSKVDITGGFPVTSENTVVCSTDEGIPCEELVQDPTAEECLNNVTYTYTVQNVAEIGFNIWQFDRTRNGETVNLVPLLGDNEFIDIGEFASVQEMEEINICEPLLSFETNLTVRKEPDFKTLCKDTYYYPIGMIPDEFE